VHECDQNIGERLRTAEKFAADISVQVEAGEVVLRRLSQIAAAARPVGVQVETAAAQSTPDARDLVAAANAIAERTRSRVSGLAA
jgi:predicted TIM-barrel fold metal-dependent hydrolase